MNAPEDHTDTDAVAMWVRETMEALDDRKHRHISIPVTMMRTLLDAVDDLREEFE